MPISETTLMEAVLHAEAANYPTRITLTPRGFMIECRHKGWAAHQEVPFQDLEQARFAIIPYHVDRLNKKIRAAIEEAQNTGIGPSKASYL